LSCQWNSAGVGLGQLQWHSTDWALVIDEGSGTCWVVICTTTYQSFPDCVLVNFVERCAIRLNITPANGTW